MIPNTATATVLNRKINYFHKPLSTKCSFFSTEKEIID